MPRGKCGAQCTGRRRGACAGRRDTRGTTNCSAVCVSPAPEEEKERHSTTAGKNNQTTREKERDPSNESNRGRVLKGKKKQTKNLCFRAKNPSRTQKPRRKKAKTPRRNHRSGKQRIGAHGPPRDLQGSVLRVLDTEETQGLPRLGTAPKTAEAYNNGKVTDTLKVLGPTLGRPLANRHHLNVQNTERAEKRANATAHARKRKQAPDKSSICLWAVVRGRPRGGGRAHSLPHVSAQLD